MFGLLSLDWIPSATSTTPPVGRAPAIVRGDPYTHVIVVTGGWADLGAETFEAQIRLARLTSATADAATADFTVTTEQDGTDLRIIISLTAAETLALPSTLSREKGYWDLQQVDGETLLSGRAKVADDVTRFVA